MVKNAEKIEFLREKYEFQKVRLFRNDFYYSVVLRKMAFTA